MLQIIHYIIAQIIFIFQKYLYFSQGIYDKFFVKILVKTHNYRTIPVF
jgi:hypothetical protein